MIAGRYASLLLTMMLAAPLVSGCSLIPDPPTNAGPQVHILVSQSESWPARAISEQLANAQKRFSECGVHLGFVRETGPGVDEDATPRLLFVSSLAPVGGKVIDGRAFSLSHPKRAEIAWAASDGTRLDHKQTVAHELGHLFGLGHVSHGRINLMAPNGCQFCRFTRTQCDVMRATVRKMTLP